ncbi:MAG: NAD(P)/FAD-dependent oxidoreductase [Pseudomonadota bacterium]
MTPDLETIVVGAGVVGLAIGRSLAERGHEVTVLERHDLIGSETSSRNSEVIHAGIYYPTGSLRAELCVAGKHKMYAFCAENGVAHAACEKLIVATDDEQLGRLDAIRLKAAENGVTDLEPLTPSEAEALEPAVRCTGALRSPSTGIVDSHGLMVALEGHIASRGGQVVLSTPVERAQRSENGRGFVVAFGGEIVTCANLILAPGLGATDLSTTLTFPGDFTPPTTYYAKGQYYALAGPSPFARHIYPMPSGAWLGLHATVDLAGRCKFGPSLQWIDEIDYAFEEGKLGQFLDAIRLYYPDLDESRLHSDYTGIRPKLYREGEPASDFMIHGPADHGIEQLVLLHGIESPGLTSSLAIGDYVAGMLDAEGLAAVA